MESLFLLMEYAISEDWPPGQAYIGMKRMTLHQPVMWFHCQTTVCVYKQTKFTVPAQLYFQLSIVEDRVLYAMHCRDILCANYINLTGNFD